jgi:hypothetical protein
MRSGKPDGHIRLACLKSLAISLTHSWPACAGRGKQPKGIVQVDHLQVTFWQLYEVVGSTTLQLRLPLTDNQIAAIRAIMIARHFAKFLFCTVTHLASPNLFFNHAPPLNSLQYKSSILLIYKYDQYI